MFVVKRDLWARLINLKGFEEEIGIKTMPNHRYTNVLFRKVITSTEDNRKRGISTIPWCFAPVQ